MGRKPKYSEAAAMQEKVDAYFKECAGELLTDNDGRPVLDKYGGEIRIGAKPPTVTGLARALGLSSRQSLLNYQTRKEFVDTVMRAKMRVEEYAEMRLFDRDGVNGAKFTLSVNFGWKVPEADSGDDDETGVVELPKVKDGKA